MIDPKGNSTVTVYDGASRTIQTQQHLREKGQGGAPPEPNQTFLAYGGASITTSTLYDGNGNVRQLVDDNGNITHWTYDSLNRQTVMTFHDGSTRTSVFNQASDVVLYTDENGSEFTSTFDAAGRKTAVSISLARPVQKVDRGIFGGSSVTVESRLPRIGTVVRQE